MESDGLQAFYFMNAAYSGKQHPETNAAFLNSTGNQLNQVNLPHNSQQNQQFVGIPFHVQAAALQDPGRSSFHCNLLTAMNSAAVAAAAARNHHQISTASEDDCRGMANMASELGVRQAVAPYQQGLSLSLSQHYPAGGAYQAPSGAPEKSPRSGNEMRILGSSSSAMAISDGITGLGSVLMSSKYLKAAQQLLDEVANVGKDAKSGGSKGTKGQMKANRDSQVMEAAGGSETNNKHGSDLSAAEGQELQMKKAKLINMLDEVEQRYRQYHHQMQVVVSTFEAAAGIGSARTYTALALNTISKQFRCLKDAIAGQIKAASSSLGEDQDCLGGGKVEGSLRLRFLDRHLRQQRALQQLGMMQQHNAWRPQRGLPERAVTVLRAWLFEHFLHPYPKDSEKLMLAQQTGLTRSQVSNWFINARVRLWKPMVEEMYKEETKQQEQSGSEDKTSKSNINEELDSTSMATAARREETNNFKARAANIVNPNATLHSLSEFPSTASTTNETAQTRPYNQKKSQIVVQNSSFIGEGLTSDDIRNGKELYMKFCSERLNRDEFSTNVTGTAGQSGSFGGYPVGEFNPERLAHGFSASTGVSLTLGLPHCENLSLSGAQVQQTYRSNQNIPLESRFDMGNEANDFCSMNTPAITLSSANTYKSTNVQNRKQFATRLLPDFVA